MTRSNGYEDPLYFSRSFRRAHGASELGGDKAAWIASLLPALEASYPAIKALVWFHMNKETDWRLDSSTAARDASIAMVNDSYLKP